MDEAEIAAADAPPMALWQKLIGAAIRARYMPTGDVPSLARLPIGRSAGGCLKRLLLLGLLIFFALLIALFLFGRALLNGSNHMTKALEPAHPNALLTARASTLVREPFGVARPTA